MKKNKLKIIVAVSILVLIISARVFKINEIISFENILDNLDAFKEFVSNNLFISSVILVLVYTSVVAFALPIATVLSLGAGLVMGVKLGVFLVVIGATIGASTNFLLTRYLFGEHIQKKHAGKLMKINTELDSNGKNYLLTLRLIPIFPFFLINIAAGLSNVKLVTFLWTTAIGIIPGTFAYVYLGTSLSSIDENSGLPPNVIFALVIIGIITLIPVVYKKIVKK